MQVSAGFVAARSLIGILLLPGLIAGVLSLSGNASELPGPGALFQSIWFGLLAPQKKR